VRFVFIFPEADPLSSALRERDPTLLASFTTELRPRPADLTTERERGRVALRARLVEALRERDPAFLVTFLTTELRQRLVDLDLAEVRERDRAEDGVALRPRLAETLRERDMLRLTLAGLADAVRLLREDLDLVRTRGDTAERLRRREERRRSLVELEGDELDSGTQTMMSLMSSCSFKL
jgi:hypothetical protein